MDVLMESAGFMSVFEGYAIVLVLLCCLYLSYTDIKFKKIGHCDSLLKQLAKEASLRACP
jgi:hypothetical protein